jgi:subtilisin family serine protease
VSSSSFPGPAQNKRLDPRLRRVLKSVEDPHRLLNDSMAGLIASRLGFEPVEAEPPAEAYSKRILVQCAHQSVPKALQGVNYRRLTSQTLSASVPLTVLEQLAADPEVRFVEAGRPLYPCLNRSLPETMADSVHAGAVGGMPLKGRGVVVGVIDFGMDYRLDDFRDDTGKSRIAFLWDQALRASPTEKTPDGFAYGVEYKAADIDAALASASPEAVVRHQAAALSHGTHVAGIAAGNGRAASSSFPAGRFIGTAPEATLIFVQPTTDADANSLTDSVRVVEAISYIFEKAEALGMPCVVNLSLGQNGGSHDGESTVERAIDSMLETPGRAFVVAAGNEHIWRGHASGKLQAGEKRTLHWRTGGSVPLSGGTSGVDSPDRSANELEIWYSSRDVLLVRVIDPLGNATATVAPGKSESISLPSGDSVYLDSERFNRLNGDARIYIEVSPEASDTITSGVWQVELEAKEIRDGQFHAWIERDPRRAQSSSSQSFFVGTDFDATLTIGTPATGRRSLAIANYDPDAQAVEASSGRGKTRDGRNKPEVAAPGTNILSCCARGGLPSLTNPSSLVPIRVPMTGTSMAAPHVAGIVALMLQRNPKLTAEQIRKILIAAAQAPPGVAVYDGEWGYGKVDARRAVELIPVDAP